MKQFEKHLKTLFKKARKKYKELAVQGADRKNLTTGDIVTKVDTEMTELIIDYFENQVEGSFSFVSEELNKQPKSKSKENNEYTVIFDEIDGTMKMRRDTGSFGPVVAIAAGSNPQFQDILASAFLDLNRGEFYEAYREEGAYIRKKFPGTHVPIKTSKRETIDEKPLLALLLDQSMLAKTPKIAKKAWRYACNDFGVQARHYAWVADGTWDAFITGGFSFLPEKEKNTAEELAGMYRIVKEAQGSVIDWQGKPIGAKEIGLEQEENYNIVAAASTPLAKEIEERIIPEEPKV